MDYMDWDEYLRDYEHLYGWILTELVYSWWFKDDTSNLPGQQLIPAFKSSEEESVFGMLMDGTITWDCTEHQRAVLEGIHWKFGPGWRNKWKEIPVCKGMDL
jgi:hypothetical protein